ncbi:divalent cation tolerance protein [Sphingomonas laterariae]|uniref:Divalent cation tolerance protein n=1 Tax=Edaphosphingomonas laterariae TaxID=861865 RepID=A0A239E1Y0_9SPHN|nr:divalent-cation tolerance protein CutA [Sphingomonas laterariae]SNS38381.1 divalent cation tolerance protein [Sphingomonas laterariae]
MTGIATVYAVFADEAEAERIGREMVEAGLAACVNILGPCRSIYRWQGAVEEGAEIPALFKTRADQADALIAAIAARHSYDVPAVVAWPITAAHPAYEAWVRDGI